jgi:hypothetical protein
MIGAILATVGVGLNVASAIGNYNASKQQVKQLKAEAKIKADNRADEILSLAATQRVRYLSAGLELEGTPQAVITDTYNTGIEDIQAIRDSYNTQISNVKKAARAQLLGGLANTAVSAYGMYAQANMASSLENMAGNANAGAIASGGQFAGTTNSGLKIWDLSGTAKSGGNVKMVDGFYSG